ncbi:MAG: oxygen-independent coproporphyrinogen III oxidase [Bacteroidales bacterium]|jgi:oxygen-independent coproporphyrinogen-3 oxidase|nr:oxygen-independent coproporphyrinogen III oxidase [Bacteroidales bacterium]
MTPSDALIHKYNQQIPRYTSYPPANFFIPQSGETLRERLMLSNTSKPNNISIYIHIPFCSQQCWYCGCNSSVCSQTDIIDTYLQSVLQEIASIIPLLDSSRKISQIHFGGGTPSLLKIEHIETLLNLFSKTFSYTDSAEIAMECNPADLSFTYISDLIKLGITRISMGIQDFDHTILQAVHRKPPHIPIHELRKHIQSLGAQVNFDFMYGLPYQTLDSFKETILQAIANRPDRLVTFSYAHLPSMKKHQQKIDDLPMATGKEKIQMLYEAYHSFTQAGYTAIGLDHFALPEDSLAQAVDKGTLHRNFQGYCSAEQTGQVYAFGASAITQLADSFFQNTRNFNDYISAIQKNNSAVESGYIVTQEEQLVSSLIESILCNKIIDWEYIAHKNNRDLTSTKAFFSFAHNSVSDLISDNLLAETNKGYRVYEQGKFFLRNIAAAFDPNMYSGKTKKFSSSL